jgi:tRNA pseudouridine38-40 synthase
VVGAGRTDAGAHAFHQVVAFDTSSRLAPEALLRALNAHLPRDIAVTGACDVHPTFHPRYDATSRVYRYLIWNRAVRSPLWRGRAAHVARRLDVGAMDVAARSLVGVHDFSAFVASHSENRSREMLRAACSRTGDLVSIELEATGFMRQMVRSIAGTLIRVGLGKLDVPAVRTILESRDRGLAGDTAPACGLYLIDVRYPAVSGSATPEENQ